MPLPAHARATVGAPRFGLGRLARPSQRLRRPAVLAVLAAAALAVLLAPVALGARATRAWASAPVELTGLSVVRQAAEFDCGPAVVATLAAWRGEPVALAVVTSQASLGSDGVSLAELARLASLHGVAGAWYSVPLGRLASLRAPFVAHLERGGAGHFVAVAAVGQGFAVVADPAAGALVGPVPELLRGYSGRAFLLEDPVQPAWEGA